MKKKLLITASTFPRWMGDTEPRFILDIAKALKKYYNVTVLVPACPGAKSKEILEGVKVIRYHYFPIHSMETLCYPGAIVPRIKEKKIRIFLIPFLFIGLYVKLHKYSSNFDYIHAHWIIPQGIVQSFCKGKYIVTGHGSDVTSLNMVPLRLLKKRCLKKAQSVVVVSQALKKEIGKYFPEINANVISMGCDVSKFGTRFRVTNYFKQEKKPVILFVGRLVEIKGVQYLIGAMKYIDAKLIIVGDGPLRDSLVRQANEQKDKIEFLGAKSHAELSVIYASADIFVAPSIITSNGAKEGLGLVILEAMASGVPVVASDTGGIPEIVKHGYNGLLVRQKDPKDLSKKINMILNNSNLKQKLVENGMKTAQERDYSNIALKYYKLVEGINGNK